MFVFRLIAAILPVLICSTLLAVSDERPQKTDKPTKQPAGKPVVGPQGIQIIINGRVVNGRIIGKPGIPQKKEQKPLALKIQKKPVYPKPAAGKISEAVIKEGLSLTIQAEKKDFAKTDKVVSFKVTLKNTSDKTISLYGENQLGIKPTLEIENVKTKTIFKAVGLEKIPDKTSVCLQLKPGEEFSRTISVDLQHIAKGKPIQGKQIPLQKRKLIPQAVPQQFRLQRVPAQKQQGAQQGGNLGAGMPFNFAVQAVVSDMPKKPKIEQKEKNNQLPPPLRIQIQGNNVQKFQFRIVPGNGGKPVLRPMLVPKQVPFARGAYKATLTLEFTKAPFSDKPNNSQWTGKITSKPVSFEVE